MKIRIPSISIILTILFFGMLPKTQAVVPAPDGGYPGANTAEGQNALFSLTTGGYNTAVGYFALRSDTTSSFNTAIGAGALFSNNAALGENTATGAGALFSNTGGAVTGAFNTANGAFALFNNTLGPSNTAVGDHALYNNTTGGAHTAVGVDALRFNTAIASNTAVGFSALRNNTSGSGNIALGANAGLNVTTASSIICIGADGANVGNSCFIGQIFGATSTNGIAVFVNSNGRLGTLTSSQRFKEEIKPMEQASEALFALKPVAFRYKKDIDPAGTPQLGLVAEDVEKLNPDLVVRDKEGKPYSVRYDQVNAMLLNEFLKEHKAFVEEQHKVENLEATVADLAAELRQVRAQVQMDHSVARVVVSNR